MGGSHRLSLAPQPAYLPHTAMAMKRAMKAAAAPAPAPAPKKKAMKAMKAAKKAFHRLLGDHVRSHRVVPQSLSFHDALHVGRPSVLRSGKNAGGVSHASADNYLLDLVTEHLFHQLGERLKLCLQLLQFLLLVLVFDVQAFFGRGLQFLAVKLLELLHGVLVDGIDHVHDLQALLPE